MMYTTHACGDGDFDKKSSYTALFSCRGGNTAVVEVAVFPRFPKKSTVALHENEDVRMEMPSASPLLSMRHKGAELLLLTKQRSLGIWLEGGTLLDTSGTSMGFCCQPLAFGGNLRPQNQS